MYFVTRIKVKKIHPWVLGLEAYITIIIGWLTYQYYIYDWDPQKQTNKQAPNVCLIFNETTFNFMQPGKYD